MLYMHEGTMEDREPADSYIEWQACPEEHLMLSHQNYLGAEYWYNPGAFNNGFKGFVTAAFSFAGTELVGLCAA